MHTSIYPPDWPKCPACGKPALDGHITCGSVQCNEGGQRRKSAQIDEREDRIAEFMFNMMAKETGEACWADTDNESLKDCYRVAACCAVLVLLGSMRE